MQINKKPNIYRLITAYFHFASELWQNNALHACWDFDAWNTRTWRVSALDKHQNWNTSALFCHDSRASSKYAVINSNSYTMYTNFLVFIYDKWDILLSFQKVIKYYQQNTNYPRSNWMHATLHLHAHNVFGVQLYKNNARTLLSHILSIVNSDWLQHARSVRGVYEWGVLHPLFKIYILYAISKLQQSLFEKNNVCIVKQIVQGTQKWRLLTANCLIETHTKLMGWSQLRWFNMIWIGYSSPCGCSSPWSKVSHGMVCLDQSGQQTSVKCAEAVWNFKVRGRSAPWLWNSTQPQHTLQSHGA